MNIRYAEPAGGSPRPGRTRQEHPRRQSAAGENMYLAAQSLGLGSHIYTGPIANLNTRYGDSVGIPAGYLGVAILKIGNTGQEADAVSSASQRKADSEIIDYY